MLSLIQALKERWIGGVQVDRLVFGVLETVAEVHGKIKYE